MDNHPPSNASAWLARRSPETPDSRDDEIARLKDRLSFYESFDSVIQENVSRAGELLRQAAGMRESADKAMETARQELESSRQAEREELEASRLAERQDFRALLSGLLDEVTTTQVQVERLARRVADALDDLESTLPAGDALDRLPKLTLPVAAIEAAAAAERPAYAEPLDPTPEEIAPEDPTTAAANLNAAATPTEVEAAVAAAEAIDLAAELEPADDASVSAFKATDVDAPQEAAAIEQELTFAEAGAPVEQTDIAAEHPAGQRTGAPTDALLDEVMESPETGGAWRAGGTAFAEPDADLWNTFGVEPVVVAAEDVFPANPPEPAPQLDDAAVQADVQVDGASDASQPAPAVTAEDAAADSIEAPADASDRAVETGEEPRGEPMATAGESSEPAAPESPSDELVADARADTVDEAAPIAAEAGEREALPVEDATPDVEIPVDADGASYGGPTPALDAAPETVEIAESSDSVGRDAPEPTVASVDAAPEHEPAAAEQRESAPPRLPWIPEDIRPFSAEGLGAAVRRGTGELRTPEPAPRPVPQPPVGTGQLVGRGTSTVVLVHGVPRATTALSLKRYLESLPHVAAVEPREYAEGILRLHVTGQRHIEIGELRGWSEGGSLEPVHVRNDLIEVRLPH